MPFKLTSPVLGPDGVIPPRNSGAGEDLSPPLFWSNVPDRCREFALLCEEVDLLGGPLRTYWVAYNISPTTTYLPEGIPPRERVEAPVRIDQGHNSSGSLGYTGPMPPGNGETRRVRFTLHALDAELGLPPGAGIAAFRKAIGQHVVATATIEARCCGRREERRTA